MDLTNDIRSLVDQRNAVLKQIQTLDTKRAELVTHLHKVVGAIEAMEKLQMRENPQLMENLPVPSTAPVQQEATPTNGMEPPVQP